MRPGDLVRYYEGPWYYEGKIEEIDAHIVVVDYLDWKQKYRLEDLKIEYIYYRPVLVAVALGERLENFDLD